MLPAAGVGDGRAAPDSGRAVEVEEESGAVAAAVLEHEVAVEQDRLNLRQQRVVLIDVTPARLDHRHLRIGEELHGAHQEIRRGDEVGVEDRDELALGDLEAGLERAGLVAGAIGAMDVGDVHAAGGVAAHGLLGDAARFVRRVIQDLDLKQLARILDLADGVDQPIGDIHLVVNRELDRHHGQGVQRSGRDRLPPLVLHV